MSVEGIVQCLKPILGFASATEFISHKLFRAPVENDMQIDPAGAFYHDLCHVVNTIPLDNKESLPPIIQILSALVAIADLGGIGILAQALKHDH